MSDDLASNLSRTADALESLIREVSDPGSEALAALHCARAALRSATAQQAGGEAEKLRGALDRVSMIARARVISDPAREAVLRDILAEIAALGEPRHE